ncbi:NAD(P)/FAD-dependent oxidoreductase [Rubellimicrobium aerolatum]|uniref:NAD(P)/FAD-dependent oxidoreductase n=1 Tax=Rubellimicrobium aerolatum TaxID=490979 RepID=A0ABW0SGU7_9RHOB|nr:FAD-dependent oxidoreductase [Rubellimicrobium aerolatum]MBP1806636.1 glycine/D-amino acid oxidase-like deaminating enzyme [Rubellimicrobium aerolatum]
MARIDVTVRGAGVLGLAVAFGCAERGARVRVVDPGGVGAGASGGLVGALSPHAPEGWDEGKALQLESLRMQEGFWARVREVGGEDAGYARTGRLMPVADDRGLAVARARGEAARGLWRGAGEWRVEAAPDGWGPVSGSGFVVRDTLAARLAPRRGLAALVAALRALGGEVVRDAADMGAVVEATGVAGLGGAGVKGQAALLRLPGVEGCPQVYAGGVYVVPHGDGTVAVGSTAEKEWTDPTGTDERLEAVIARARALVPALGDAPVVERWAAVRPRAPSGALWLGGSGGRFVANGGFRTGFGMAPLVGRLMADLVLEGRDAIPAPFRAGA